MAEATDKKMGSRCSINARQSQILEYIKQYIFSNGYPPSVREIGKAVGLSSSASVHNKLKKLAEASSDGRYCGTLSTRHTGSLAENEYRSRALPLDRSYCNKKSRRKQVSFCFGCEPIDQDGQCRVVQSVQEPIHRPFGRSPFPFREGQQMMLYRR